MAPTSPASGEFIVLATFESRRATERVVASLGHEFRAAARRRKAAALVLSANPDGSLKLTQSRAETASDLTAVIIRLTLSLILGFIGLLAMIQGTEKAGRAAQARQGHVGSDETRAHEILAEVGPNAGFLLIRCSNQQMVDEVTAKVNEHAIFQWTGTREKFLESLGAGNQYDWVRNAIGESSR